MSRGNASVTAKAGTATGGRGDVLPGRGRYDRSATASERARRQRAGLITAARQVCVEGGEITVSRLLVHVECGRNTFYEHFDDAPAAVRAACDESAAQFETVIEHFMQPETLRTPNDAMLDLAVTWAAWSRFDQARHWTLLERLATAQIERTLLVAVHYLHGCLIDSGSAGGELSATRAAAACGALRAIAHQVDERQLEEEESERTIAESCHDVLVRLLR